MDRAVHCYFGKSPQCADFISGGLDHPASREYRNWVEAAVQFWSTHHLRELWTNDASPFGLIYPGKHGVVIALLVPSQDTIGRLFPLSVYCCVSSWPKSAFSSLVLNSVNWVNQAAQALDSYGTDRAGLDALIESMSLFEFSAETDDDVFAWAQQQPINEYVNSLNENGTGALLIRNLQRVAQSLCTGGGGNRLVTSAPVGELRAQDVTFWSTLYQSWTRNAQQEVPVIAWSQRCKLALSPSVGFFGALWQEESENIFPIDLASADGNAHDVENLEASTVYEFLRSHTHQSIS